MAEDVEGIDETGTDEEESEPEEEFREEEEEIEEEKGPRKISLGRNPLGMILNIRKLNHSANQSGINHIRFRL